MIITLEVEILPLNGWRVVTIDDFPYVVNSSDEDIAEGHYNGELFTEGFVAGELGFMVRDSLRLSDHCYRAGHIHANVHGDSIAV